MFCRECGGELVGNEPSCASCGASTDLEDALVTRSARRANAQEDNGREYRSYEYARTSVKADLVQVTLDCYESLGFELTGQRTSTPGGQVTLSFRRSRKVRAKAQLSKIQRTMDDAVARIAGLEAEKTKKATSQGIAIGVVSALVLGVGMCCSMVWTNLMVLGVIVGIIGIAGCIFAWMRYRRVCESESARIDPQIEAAYDRLATLCEEAQAVLRMPE